MFRFMSVKLLAALLSLSLSLNADASTRRVWDTIKAVTIGAVALGIGVAGGAAIYNCSKNLSSQIPSSVDNDENIPVQKIFKQEKNISETDIFSRLNMDCLEHTLEFYDRKSEIRTFNKELWERSLNWSLEMEREGFLVKKPGVGFVHVEDEIHSAKSISDLDWLWEDEIFYDLCDRVPPRCFQVLSKLFCKEVEKFAKEIEPSADAPINEWIEHARTVMIAANHAWRRMIPHHVAFTYMSYGNGIGFGAILDYMDGYKSNPRNLDHLLKRIAAPIRYLGCRFESYKYKDCMEGSVDDMDVDFSHTMVNAYYQFIRNSREYLISALHDYNRGSNFSTEESYFSCKKNWKNFKDFIGTCFFDGTRQYNSDRIPKCRFYGRLCKADPVEPVWHENTREDIEVYRFLPKLRLDPAIEKKMFQPILDIVESIVDRIELMNNQTHTFSPLQ